MKSIIGKNVTICIYGESHASQVGAVLDGLPAGILVDRQFMQSQMEKRKPKGKISTARQEEDFCNITTGVFNGYTTGTPINIFIENKNCDSKVYNAYIPRPSHADYVAHVKYKGYQDYRGGGHFSGRVTAAIVAAGSIAIDILRKKDIHIATHIKSCNNVEDRDFQDYIQDVKICNQKKFAVLDVQAEQKMKECIENAKKQQDSVGGVLETCVINMPVGVGEPYFYSIESQISHYLFSIGGIKGIEFGLGFGFATTMGSRVNDPFAVKNGSIITKSNNNGGINGGISNGMPIIFRCAVKPTASIYLKQDTVNLKQMQNTTIQIEGRHDPAIFHRARVVVDSLTALALLDLLVEKFGQEWLV